MLSSFLIGLTGGQRALTPLAAVSLAARHDRTHQTGLLSKTLAHPATAAITTALAIAELIGDKQKTAPDRTVPIGLAARFLTSAIAGAYLAPRPRRGRGALIGGVTAIVASWPGWRARTALIPAYGQTRTGLVEDALVILGTAAIVRHAGKTETPR